jgi:hypothetical protein
MTDLQIDQKTKEDKKKMAVQQKAAMANKSKSKTSPHVRKPTLPKSKKR